MLALLMGFAFSDVGLVVGGLAVIALCGMAVYLRLPASIITALLVGFAGWLLAGSVFQAGEASRQASIDKAVAAAELKWQLGVGKAQAAARTRLETRETATRARQSDADAYERKLLNKKDSCIVTDDDARDML
ncbi:hypothetical protein OSH11_13905 [Kaistia dalseonensis]|uniref:Uncharacterized protein n=1 Tax=Kaistia dalseonensis TaxID=410840 RepID=A0ABU0H801_9HYPH|nr:hypothetical protein [Kaistia dalseonensis]MCX5495804.1 hypothetical protein [Kaistia dalseonensis]MDQ0438405.1 hypothetical protein [Kaistia dalseonensis]